jgi:hypothetical protein
VHRLGLIDLLAVLPTDGKLKLIGILKDLPTEEQGDLIKMLGGL